ncbi:hypothetical protein [Phytoactinopolyspora halotolerans]|uniref:Uncharacterized protein n=1 Tax=Phytoactinopolyspora halotolerans TaxID=1981512 RepID=A0A6L9SIK5_9ACTN|nr:hypothetical protein [Phytoactinopolyspora halotolerans]NEE03900.1 hypothetical protein [Phytoactinopolyspora halotolerans]
MGSEKKTPSRLPHTEGQLARAERVLKAQRHRSTVGPDFADYAPYVLDCAAHIGRVFKIETGPTRGANNAFSVWWHDLLQDDEFDWLRQYRDTELKDVKRITRILTTIRTQDGGILQVHDVGLSVTKPDGTTKTSRAKDVNKLPPGGTAEYIIRIGPWADQEFTAAIGGFLTRWRDVLLPAALEFVRQTSEAPPRQGLAMEDGPF